MKRARLVSGTAAALFAGCLILLNLLAAGLRARADFSAGRLYSLSAGSRRVLRALPGPVAARFYVSRELPGEYAARRAYVEDLLAEYVDAGGGKFSVAVLDASRAELRDEAAQSGVLPIEFNIVSQEKFQIAQGMIGVVLQYEDKREVLPVVLREDTLEYELTSRIRQLTRPRRRVIGMLAGHGAVGPHALAAPARARLERDYDLRAVDLTELPPGAPLDPEIEAMLVLGPSARLEDYHLYTLDQFLLSGRPLAVAVDMRQTDLQQFMARSAPSGLAKVLAGYGARPVNNLVLDAQNRSVQVAQRRGFLTFANIVSFPPLVVATDLAADHPITRHLDSLVLPFVSPLEISTAAARARVLARSSGDSWLKAAWGRAAVHSISPLQRLDAEDGDPRGPFVLAAALEGPFTSAFADRDLPGEADAAAFAARSSAHARLFVVGSAGFARADFGEAGSALLLSAVDWLLLEDDLIAIRAKGYRLRPLRAIADAGKTLVRWTIILGPVLLVAGGGLLRRRLRARGRDARRRAYAPAHALERA